MEKNENRLRKEQFADSKQKSKRVVRIPLVPIIVLIILMGTIFAKFGKNTFNLPRN